MNDKWVNRQMSDKEWQVLPLKRKRIIEETKNAGRLDTGEGAESSAMLPAMMIID